MGTVVVGAGPVGLLCAIVLARQGREVTVVDRDSGPAPDGTWHRRGVMQFHHPHYFRQIVRQALLDAAPDVWDAAIAAGGELARLDGMPEDATGLHCRRSTFERVMWSVAAKQSGLRLRTGHADHLLVDGGRVTGLVVDGTAVEADTVICAVGRASRFADDIRPPGTEQSCGFSYVARMYRGRPGAPWVTTPGPLGTGYDGYQAIVFPHDSRTLSTLFVRPSSDKELGALRDNAAFEAIAPLIPRLAPWVDQTSYEPITDVMVGGRLTNGYRSQLDEEGRAPVAGLHFVGDAVSTTNPAPGRGVSLGMRQAQALTGLLAQSSDARDATEAFDAWCAEQIEPWYDNQVRDDAYLLGQYAGQDIDVEGQLPPTLIFQAAAEDPAMMPVVGPYLSMRALPDSLHAVEESARAVLRTGWRPSFAAGPSRDELVERLQAVSA